MDKEILKGLFSVRATELNRGKASEYIKMYKYMLIMIVLFLFIAAV